MGLPLYLYFARGGGGLHRAAAPIVTGVPKSPLLRLFYPTQTEVKDQMHEPN